MSGQSGQVKRKIRESRLLTPPRMFKRMGKAQSRQGYALSMG
jgi:hypothetical protein